MVLRFTLFGDFRNVNFQTSLKINSKKHFDFYAIQYTPSDQLCKDWDTMYITQLQTSQTLHQTNNLYKRINSGSKGNNIYNSFMRIVWR